MAEQSDEPEQTIYLPYVTVPASNIIITAVHIDSAISYEPDEAIQLWNTGGRTQSLAGWQLSTASRRATFPTTTTLSLLPGQHIWCAAEDSAFQHSFGYAPACAWEAAESSAIVPIDGSLSFTNHGGHIHLRNGRGKLVDTLLYGDASYTVEGWIGAPAQAYARGAIGKEGQVLQRKRHSASSLPLDSDRASDWAGDVADIEWGRRVYYPGWELENRVRPRQSYDSASVTVAVAPEGLFSSMNTLLASAQHSIDLSLYVFEHPQLAQTIAGAARRGVDVRLLLEGSPVGGVADMQRWCVSHMAAAGADIRYLAVTDAAPNGYNTRFRYAHAKYGVMDGMHSFVGTENLTWDAAPVEIDGLIGGRRGFFLITDAVSVAQELSAIFESDWRPDTFLDLHPYQSSHQKYGDPPPGYALPPPPEYRVGSAPFGQPVTSTGYGHFVVASAPENVLRPDDGLFVLLDRADANDEILVAQLYEHKYWGDAHSNPVADPNPRLERMLDAARRGARVRLLLDSHFDDAQSQRSNLATAEYVRTIAANEHLDLEVRLADPAGGGLHAKLVLIRVAGETWSAVGSLNGSEISNKLNREVMLMTDMTGVHVRLAEVFNYDWNNASP